jgi:predicted glycosyltransferase
VALSFKPDIFVGQAFPHFAYTSLLFRKPFVIFEDTENSKLLQKIVNPFASTIITPNSFQNDLGKKHIRVKSSFELAYLRENWFTPNPKVLKSLNLVRDEIFTLVRFVSWTANHDIGHKGISDENKKMFVSKFLKFGKVFISSEGELPIELRKYSISIK